MGSSHKITKLEGDSPVGGQGRGQGRRTQGFPCGLIMWGLGCFPCKESWRGVGCLTLPQRPHRESHCLPAPCTIELLQAFAVVLGQAVLGGVAHRALVKGPHDRVRRRGVAQAQGMAKLMNSHSKQVSPLTICGGRESGLDLWQPGKGQQGSPWEWGLLADRNSQETLRRWPQSP